MPKFDAAKHQWNNVFVREKTPTLPIELTKAWWDKHKSALAKLAISTGIGDALTKVEAAYKGLDLGNPDREYNPGRPDMEKVNFDRCEAFKNSGKVKTFHDALVNASNTVQTTLKTLKKNPLVSKGTVTAAEDVKDNADKLMLCVNANGLGGALQAAVDAYKADQGAKFRAKAKGVLDLAKPAGAKAAGVLAGIKALAEGFPDVGLGQEHWGKVGAPTHTLTRDLSQPAGNLVKALDAGAAINGADPAGLKALLKQLAVYSNAQNGAHIFAKMTTKAEILTVLANIAPLITEYNRLISAMSIAG